MTTQTKDNRSANARPTSDDGRDAGTGFESASEAAVTITEQARDAALAGTRQVQDSIVAMVRQGQNSMLTMARMWTESVGRLTPYGVPSGQAGAMPVPASAAVRGGYDLFEQLLADQRRFVDALIAEQRRLAETLFTPPGQG